MIIFNTKDFETFNKIVMRKFLKSIYVLQEVSNKNRTPILGRGSSTACRLRVFNPLTYIVIALVLILGIICFGIIGFWGQIDKKNPFKWN